MMNSVLISAAAVIVVLGIMIVVHEWGHFVAAKLLGVRVDVFSLGFGPRLAGFRRGATDYRLSALPFGGYVKMAGDNPVEERTGALDEFLSKPRWQRFLIAMAGPTMNILMAVVIGIGLAKVGLPQPDYIDRPAVIAGVLKDSPAEKAGIRPGDRVIKINGINNPKWDDLLFELMFTPAGSRVSAVLDRGGQQIPVSIIMPAGSPARGPANEFAIFGYPEEPAIVDTVTPGMPAAHAGLQPGDQVVEADGRNIISRFQFTDEVQQSQGQPMDFVVLRNGQPVHLKVKATYGDPGDGVPRWQIGILLHTTTVYKSASMREAVSRGVRSNIMLTRQIVYTIAELFAGKVSVRQLEGPLGIAKQSGEAARRGPLDFFNLMALISLNLGILNLLPIPILDGGHILLLAIEGTIRRDLSIAIKERFVQVGFVFLLLIFAVAMYNDVLRLLPAH